MQTITTVAELAATLDNCRARGATVGLVPTMGALHEGHASLISRAAAECDQVVVSVFVNPTQFGPGEDFAAYPRDLAADSTLAARHGATVIFAPPVAEMYPGGTSTSVRVRGLTDRLEGASRPGHFDGVATVVAKLFSAVGRCRAYFGEKDFQQLAVVRRMAADLLLPVDVVGCSTVRDDDGLALSSRNRYLNADERTAALVLHRALLAGKTAVLAGASDVAAVVDAMAAVVRGEPLAQLDYAAVVDPSTLEEPTALGGPVRLLVAARVGPARLIDNIGVEASASGADTSARTGAVEATASSWRTTTEVA